MKAFFFLNLWRISIDPSFILLVRRLNFAALFDICPLIWLLECWPTSGVQNPFYRITENCRIKELILSFFYSYIKSQFTIWMIIARLSIFISDLPQYNGQGLAEYLSDIYLTSLGLLYTWLTYFSHVPLR